MLCHRMNGLGCRFHLQIPNQQWVALFEESAIVISNVENSVDGIDLETAFLCIHCGSYQSGR